MPMSKSEYQKIVEKILRPTLIDNGFHEIRLTHLNETDVLYRKNDLWFGTSWDWREISGYFVGKLYWFKDFMPRIVVVGDYSSYLKEIGRSKIIVILIQLMNPCQKQGKFIDQSFAKVYESKYDQSTSSNLLVTVLNEHPILRIIFLIMQHDSNWRKNIGPNKRFKRTLTESRTLIFNPRFAA